MASKSEAGKGSKPRPYNKRKYDANFDSIKWKKKPKKELLNWFWINYTKGG